MLVIFCLINAEYLDHKPKIAIHALIELDLVNCACSTWLVLGGAWGLMHYSVNRLFTFCSSEITDSTIPVKTIRGMDSTSTILMLIVYAIKDWRSLNASIVSGFLFDIEWVVSNSHSSSLLPAWQINQGQMSNRIITKYWKLHAWKTWVGIWRVAWEQLTREYLREPQGIWSLFGKGARNTLKWSQIEVGCSWSISSSFSSEPKYSDVAAKACFWESNNNLIGVSNSFLLQSKNFPTWEYEKCFRHLPFKSY